MEIAAVFCDTSVVLEHFRKKDKTKSLFFRLQSEYVTFCISSVTLYEILIGCKTEEQKQEWRDLLADFVILPFDEKAAEHAALSFLDLKKRNSLIEFRDTFIASIATSNGLKLATLNLRDFSRIIGLDIYTLENCAK